MAKVETAMQLWLGDLLTAYNQTVDLVGQFKVDAAKDVAARLQDLTYQMSAATVVIRQNANDLAPELGAAWVETEKQTNELHNAASGLKAQLGVQKPVLDPLKAARDSADDAINKSWEFTKNFGKKYGELMGGPVENAKQMFDGAVTDRYESTVQYLEAWNSDRGKVEIDGLEELLYRLNELGSLGSTNAAALARPLADFWKPTEVAILGLKVEVVQVRARVGNEEPRLGEMKSLYADLNAALVRSYNDILAFGEKFRAICDDWR